MSFMIETVPIVNMLCLVPLLPRIPPWLTIFCRCPVLLTWMAGDKWSTQVVQRCCLAHRSFKCCVPWQMKEGIHGWAKITTDFFVARPYCILSHHWVILFCFVGMFAPNIGELIWNDPIWFNLTSYSFQCVGKKPPQTQSCSIWFFPGVDWAWVEP